MNTHERVLHFIHLLKGHKNGDGHDAHDILETIYTRGNCYMFAKALQFVFPEAVLYSHYIHGYHVLVKIEDRFYDITGEYHDLDNSYFPLDEGSEKQAMTWCYSHKERGPYGLRDSNGKYIYKLFDMKEIDFNKVEEARKVKQDILEEVI